MLFQQKNINYNYSPLIYIDHKSIEQVTETKFLGIIVDQKLTWEKHVDSVVSKLSSICFVIRQLRPTVSLDVLKMAYYGLVHSVLSYGLIFWGNSAHMHRVFIMQKKIIRCCVGASPRESCKQIFKNLAVLTLPCLYIYLITLDIKRNYSTHVRNNMIHNYCTRTGSDLRLPFSRLAVGQNSPTYQGIICHNHFVRIFGNIDNIRIFKSVLLQYLKDNAFYSVEEFLNSEI